MQNTWSIVKFIVPVLLPVATIVLAWGTGTKGPAVRARLEAALGSGQLLWAAMVISSYGASIAMKAGLFEPRGIPPGLQALLILQCLLVLISAHFITSVSQMIVENDEEIEQAYAKGKSLPAKRKGRAVFLSFVMSAAAIGMAALTEAWVA
ncbi:hypothetical protein [Noviherbaspirillum sp. Root189]|uniref:hypothetical protein n=1 Tax=Noviherbaspirillum sp. Root189 TaxID=1736487 RepID=UPI0007139A05|nr:hypothetical protein [Noviherbaspirillum sp. Root189]KRB74252.1 hypothetical protein ASE07_26770 [Noviherbaspirillum sp. Root189]